MLEWLEVRFDVGCDKRLVYEYRIELLNLKCDRDAPKQECRLHIACSSTQLPTHLSEKVQRARSYYYYYYYYYGLTIAILDLLQ